MQTGGAGQSMHHSTHRASAKAAFPAAVAPRTVSLSLMPLVLGWSQADSYDSSRHSETLAYILDDQVTRYKELGYVKLSSKNLIPTAVIINSVSILMRRVPLKPLHAHPPTGIHSISHEALVQPGFFSLILSTMPQT